MGKAVIMLVIGFTVIFSGLRVSIQETAVEAVENASSNFSTMQAKLIAESGANFILTRLKEDPLWRGEETNIPMGNGQASVSAIDRADLNENAVEIKSIGLFNAATDSVGVVLNALPVSDRFSRFSYFSNREDGIWFYSADTLYGPVHTNGRFNITGSPVFHGLVSSVSSIYNTWGSTNPQFLGGTDFGRDRIDLEPDFDPLIDAANNGGHKVLYNSLYLIFINDGTYQYRVGSSGSWNSRSIPANGVIYSNRNIYVEGTVNGRVSIMSTRDIYLTDDVIYADNPESNPESQNLLGLIAYDDVIVQDNADTRGGITIQATILTRDGSFKAENIYFYPTGQLNIYGGIVQEVRGAVGRISSPPTGFEKNYRYDARMEYIYPPFYPIAPGATANLIEKGKIEVLFWK